jgi:hypothetical protein
VVDQRGDVAVLLDELRRRLLAEPGDAGQVVAGSPRSAANSGYCSGERPYFSWTLSGVMRRMSDTPRAL